MANCIEVQKITQRFQDKTVLKQINITVENNEVFGLLGPSGAGKTTLIKILTGQQRQTEGTAMLLGQDTGSLDRAARSSMGMVMDNAGLYERLTCYDNLRLFAKLYGISKERIQVVLKKVGLSDALKVPAMKLSKGMRQRLVLARAVLNEPKILFLDEPTSGLDPSMALEIHGLIQEQRENGTTIFLTTHNMEEATKLCDTVALLHGGDIVEYGNPKELCRRYNHQNKIQILLKTGEQVELLNNGKAAQRIAGYLEQEVIETIHSTEPNLETVFVELTGRGLM